jgi:hypothetical protein
MHEDGMMGTPDRAFFDTNEWVMLGTNDREREVRGVPAIGRSFRIRGA